MAGHSKWANIQHRKKKQDAKRGKLFTKFIREIVVAARMGGEDPGSNSRLRSAIDDAYAGNMTKDTIMRAVKRGAGGQEGGNLQEIRYEGYGVNGVAVMVDCLTDNKNRTVSEVRHAFTKCGGNLGTDGSVAYLFTKQGSLIFEPGSDEDAIMMVAVDSGADDVVVHDDSSIEVVVSPEAFNQVREALVAANLEPVNAEVMMAASVEVTLGDAVQAEKLMRLQDMLEDLDDVQKVYTNAYIPEEIMQQLDD